MTQRQIPFSLERWKEGLKPVTRDGMEVICLTYNPDTESDERFAGWVNKHVRVWHESGAYFMDAISELDLMLLEEVREPREWPVVIINGFLFDTRNLAGGADSVSFLPKGQCIKVREVLE